MATTFLDDRNSKQTYSLLFKLELKGENMFSAKSILRKVLIVVLAIGVGMSCMAARCKGEVKVKYNGHWENGKCWSGGNECTVELKGEFDTKD
ncbi:MAG: hypothetical protein AAB305_03815 [Candidatus Zixiibacteriota bacterium]